MNEKKTLYERIKQLDKQVRWLTKGEKQMKIESSPGFDIGVGGKPLCV